MPYFFVDTTVSHALLFTHRCKTHAAQLFKNQSATKTPADHLLWFVRGSRGVQANMAKRLNAEIRLIAGDEIQATASHDRAKGEIGGAGEASYRARDSVAHRVHVAADHLTHQQGFNTQTSQNISGKNIAKAAPDAVTGKPLETGATSLGAQAQKPPAICNRGYKP
jgi:hypothetical protein